MADLEGWLEAGIWVTSRDGDRVPADFGSLVADLGSPLQNWKLESRDEYMDRRVQMNVPPWAEKAWKRAESCHSRIQAGLL